MTIEIQHNVPDVIDVLQRLADTGNDLTPAMRGIAGVLANATEHAFEYEVDPDTGEHWAGLLPETIAQREKKGYWPGQILQRTSLLATSIQTDHGSDFAQIGSNLPYAAAQHFGYEENNLEARPYIGLGPDDVEEVLDILEIFFSDAL